jgi:hypothetical protein
MHAMCLLKYPLVYKTLLNKWRIVMYIFSIAADDSCARDLDIFFCFFHYIFVSNLRLYFFLIDQQ